MFSFAKSHPVRQFSQVKSYPVLHKWLYGINTTTLIWIKDYLSNRTRQVVIPVIPAHFPVSHRCPFWALSFFLYINHFPEGVSSSIKFYTDDTLVCRVILISDDICTGSSTGPKHTTVQLVIFKMFLFSDILKRPFSSKINSHLQLFFEN